MMKLLQHLAKLNIGLFALITFLTPLQKGRCAIFSGQKWDEIIKNDIK